MPSLLARARLVAPRYTNGPGVRTYPRSALPAEVRAAIASRAPALEPYAVVARAWHAHGSAYLPPYARYVRSLARAGEIGTEAALDLACGTGISTAGLAAVFRRVVALDSSAHMLAEARTNLAAFRNVEVVQRDFRSFSLPEPVDLAVCSGDSLNYVQSAADLRAVLRCVADALRPGGLLLLDVQSERAFEAWTGVVVLSRASGVEWYQVHDYDPATRIDDACAVTAQGVEPHRRMFIAGDDLAEAARAAGLEVEPRFDHPLLRVLASWALRDFYAIRRPRA